MTDSRIGNLEGTLRAKRNEGRKLLVPYVTGGLGDWVNVVHAIIEAGADAVEIGIPFSDPIMDGPTIQEASQKALDEGATPLGILGDIRRAQFGAPVAVMTYYNLVYHAGHERFASTLRECGVSAAILPDLQLDEAGPWIEVADRNEIENVLLVAPSTPDERLAEVSRQSKGFVYGAGVMGVTGERRSLADSASRLAERLKNCTNKPVLIGVGISTPEQAGQVSQVADGVIVGSALVRRILAGAGPEGAYGFVSELRRGIDEIGSYSGNRPAFRV